MITSKKGFSKTMKVGFGTTLAIGLAAGSFGLLKLMETIHKKWKVYFVTLKVINVNEGGICIFV